jgi:hypothetical protein
MKALGCLGTLVALALAATVMAPEMLGLAALYSYLIGKAAVEQVAYIPTRGRIDSTKREIDPGGVATDSANVSFALPSGEQHRAVLSRQVRPDAKQWIKGQTVHILVSRLNTSNVTLDSAWHLRPEGKKQINDLMKMAAENSDRRK